MRQKVLTQYSSEHVEAILKAAVIAATQGYSAAKHEFWRVCAKQTGGEPQKVREAAAATGQSLAKERMIGARVRLNRFMLDGTIPEELKYLDGTEERSTAASA
jgi:hypothetical protein